MMTHNIMTNWPRDKSYVTSHGQCYDAFRARQDPMTFFSLGKVIDGYQFRRRSEPGLATRLLDHRIKELRKKHQYLRLWYSGGKDSQLILDTAIKNGIHIDEILIVWFGYRNHRNMWPTWSPFYEIDQVALPYIDKIKSLIPNTKITVASYDEPVYEHVFAQPDWHRKSLNWFIHCQNAHHIFYDIIQPEFKFVDEIEDRCDLIGGTTPEIWWDDRDHCWKFCYVDLQLLNSIGPTNEDFLLGTENGELLEAHVNSIIDKFESIGYRPARFQKESICNAMVDGHRQIRDCSEIYQFNVFHEISTPKTLPENMTFPFDHYLWKHQGSKGFWCIVNMMAQPKWPKCLELYVNNTNWSEIRWLDEKKGMLSRVFSVG